MKNDLLNTLPPPKPGKTGWPWLIDEKAMETINFNDRDPWPRISIVTPSFNQAQFLEETIRSVLLQGYPNLEYIIIDGGSTDGSVEIIKEYEPWLAYWVSETDRGQGHAINKGFSRSTGEILAWVNSDDYYTEKAFSTMRKASIFYNDALWFAGPCKFIELDNSLLPGWGKPVEEIERWFVGPLVMQPGVFWRRSLWEKTASIDEALNYSFDYDLWLKFVKFQSFPSWVDDQIAFFRLQPESKTVSQHYRFFEEDKIVHNRNIHLLPTFNQKFRVWFLRREHAANKKYYRTKAKGFVKIFFLVFSVLSIAPWFLLKKSFYVKLKNLLLSEK